MRPLKTVVLSHQVMPTVVLHNLKFVHSMQSKTTVRNFPDWPTGVAVDHLSV